MKKEHSNVAEELHEAWLREFLELIPAAITSHFPETREMSAKEAADYVLQLQRQKLIRVHTEWIDNKLTCVVEHRKKSDGRKA